MDAMEPTERTPLRNPGEHDRLAPGMAGLARSRRVAYLVAGGSIVACAALGVVVAHEIPAATAPASSTATSTGGARPSPATTSAGGSSTGSSTIFGGDDGGTGDAAGGDDTAPGTPVAPSGSQPSGPSTPSAGAAPAPSTSSPTIVSGGSTVVP